MGFYRQAFATIRELRAELEFAPSAERCIEIYDELKQLRRNICRNSDTRNSYLVPSVTGALNTARRAIAAHKMAAVQELQIMKMQRDEDVLYMCHRVFIIVSVVLLYMVILGTGRV